MEIEIGRRAFHSVEADVPSRNVCERYPSGGIYIRALVVWDVCRVAYDRVW